jgi:hypothetical protein
MTLQFDSLNKKFYAPQFNALAYANTNAVLAGCECTAQTIPNMTVAVSSGKIFFGVDTKDITGANVSITANASAYTRIDLIAVDALGALSAIAGTASVLPVPATYNPDDYIILAMIFVSPGAVSITSSMILDNRVLNIGGGGGSSGGSFGRYSENFTAQTSVTVQHNLGDANPMVFVYDDNDELIQADSITIVDSNSVTVDFSASTTGKIIVFGGNSLNNGYYKTTFTSQTSVTVTHNLANQYVNVMVYNDSDELIEPQTVTLDDENSCTVTFGASTSGTIVCTGGIATTEFSGKALTAIASTDAANNSVFLDSADNIVKVKDNSGNVGDVITSYNIPDEFIKIPNISMRLNNAMITSITYMAGGTTEIFFKIPVMCESTDTIKTISAVCDAVVYNEGNGNDQKILWEYSTNDTDWSALGDIETGASTGSGVIQMLSATGKISGLSNTIVYLRLRRYQTLSQSSNGTINIKHVSISYTTTNKKNNVIQMHRLIENSYINSAVGLASPVYSLGGAGSLSNGFPIRLYAPESHHIKGVACFGSFVQTTVANSTTQVYTPQLSTDGGAYGNFASYQSDSKLTSSGQTRCGKYWGYSTGLNALYTDVALSITVGYFSITNLAIFVVGFYEKD